MVKSRTLRELLANYSEANGVVIISAGNGCVDAAWIWQDDCEQYGDVIMHPAKPDDDAYDDGTPGTLVSEVLSIVDYYDGSDGMWASDWIIDGTGDNPYRYRIIF